MEDQECDGRHNKCRQCGYINRQCQKCGYVDMEDRKCDLAYWKMRMNFPYDSWQKTIDRLLPPRHACHYLIDFATCEEQKINDFMFFRVMKIPFQDKKLFGHDDGTCFLIVSQQITIINAKQFESYTFYIHKFLNNKINNVFHFVECPSFAWTCLPEDVRKAWESQWK